MDVFIVDPHTRSSALTSVLASRRPHKYLAPKIKIFLRPCKYIYKVLSTGARAISTLSILVIQQALVLCLI